MEKTKIATTKKNTLVNAKSKTTNSAVNLQKQNELKKPIIETTADKRIKSLNLFTIICKKYNFLKAKNDELNSYLVGRDGLKETLRIENSEGLEFEISNSAIMTKIMELCQSELTKIMEETEQEVINFNV